ncbi:acetylornithine aminotransferase [Penicillium argentinense]|uniref:Acetylornithine aminotransferase n=1 Tax=Penicillium argentinense TaxID=1131581 RepID=A0A9W9G380_9EURO|nr:acetylornithine aminotransferase [Penicillium argentinense]KAJ5111294.1 acetylornithine aminotransferase [Penicillium argentinense]
MPDIALAKKLQALVQQYEKSHPESKRAFERAEQVLPGGSTRSVLVSDPFPLVIKSAHGAQFTTVDGVKFDDFLSDFSAGIYGHSHPVIQEAVQQALSTGFSLGGITEKEAELGEILAGRFPSIEKVRFCNSGTEANTFAVATALAHTQRKKVLVFKNGYHGGTMNFSKPDNPMNIPHQFVFGTYNDIEATRAVVNNEIGAILVEPMQGAGGMIRGTREFLSYLRQAADEIGAILIFDEVVTSRLHYRGMQGELGIIPDMTTLGKYIGGGFPFGAFGGSTEIMSRFDSRDKSVTLHHSGTFNNNIFTMSAAVAASRLITESQLRRLNAMGDRLREEATEILRKAKFDEMSFTGYGSAVGIHFSGDDAEALREYFYFGLINRGISIGRRGFVSLNLAHTEESVDRLLEALKAFVDDLS